MDCIEGMKPDFITIAIILFIVAVYLYSYVQSKRYKYEGFQGSPPPPAAPTDPQHPHTDIAVPDVELPYTQQQINDEDYEYNMVFLNETEEVLDKNKRNMLMSQYPKDWPNYPPSSSKFQSGLAGYKQSFEDAKQNVPDEAKSYDTINGNLMSPPDLSETEKEERKILQTYKPKFPPGPTSYDPRDVNDLIKQIYDKKGLIPQVHHKEGTNVYEIVGVRKANEHVKFEDEPADATPEPNKKAGEGTAKTPPAVKDTFQNRFQDASKWTPGLEQMFAS